MILALTPGDPSGIGPEVTWQAIRQLHRNREMPRLLCVGARKPFDEMGVPVREITLSEVQGLARIPRSRTAEVLILAAPERAPRGRLLDGYQSGWSIETATRLVLDKKAAALVTGPISKERMHAGGYRYPGHTEFLAKLCGSKRVTMMLANSQLRVSLVTTHLALKDVSRSLKASEIETTVLQTWSGLREGWGIRCPQIAITALNPHAGEGGLFGSEEIRIIQPTIQKLKKKLGSRARLSGPHPADTLFSTQTRYDAVVCMYHDQGLIPVKLIDFANTVNITLGLPIIRTSVDHGTGFDIAGKGIADPSSMIAAIRLASTLAHGRKRR